MSEQVVVVFVGVVSLTAGLEMRCVDEIEPDDITSSDKNENENESFSMLLLLLSIDCCFVSFRLVSKAFSKLIYMNLASERERKKKN